MLRKRRLNQLNSHLLRFLNHNQFPLHSSPLLLNLSLPQQLQPLRLFHQSKKLP
jgi:hypothetical protein